MHHCNPVPGLRMRVKEHRSTTFLVMQRIWFLQFHPSYCFCIFNEAVVDQVYARENANNILVVQPVFFLHRCGI